MSRGRRAALALIAFLAVAGPVGWLELVYSAQVNASLAAVKASQRIVGPGRDTSTRAPEGLDHWGRPFARFESEGCLALVSFGSDGVADEAYDARALCARTARTSACGWTTRDIVVVNGVPIQACLK